MHSHRRKVGGTFNFLLFGCVATNRGIGICLAEFGMESAIRESNIRNDFVAKSSRPALPNPTALQL